MAGRGDLRGISACLLGLACRYDGQASLDDDAVRIARAEALIPFCPEQLGGLPTPRTPAEIVGGDGDAVLDGRARVVDREGRDVTEAFLAGARQAADLCARLGIKEVLLKARSPSCGVGMISRGAALVAGDGVTAAFLRRSGIRVRCLQG